MDRELTARQREILRRVVEDYVATGQPVGSKTLVERARLPVSPSTVRSELAELERRGLLTHPHTSAGRIPTDEGYRFYVDALLARLDAQPATLRLDFTAERSEVEEALRETTEMLSRFTRLLALVSAPPLERSTIRHVEVLQLQPQVVVVVVITSAGGVAKRLVTFPEPVDAGLVKWASDYLNEQAVGVQLGTHLLRQRLTAAGLSQSERSFLQVLAPVFTDVVDPDDQRLFVGGAATLLSAARPDELEACRRLLEALEERATALAILGRALEPMRPFVRVGVDLTNPALRNVSLVGASYGLAHRTLGAVSLLGPMRMDYDKAIRSVRAAAHELSRFVEEFYAEN